MGKQAKLKQARREGIAIKKEPVYNMTQTQLDAYVSREILKFKKNISIEITDKIVSTMLIQCFDVLNSYFDFGNLRLQRFRYYMDSLSELIADATNEEPNFDYCSEVIQTLEGKRVDVDKLLKGNIDEHSLRRRCDMEKALPKVSDFIFEEVVTSGKEKAEANS